MSESKKICGAPTCEEAVAEPFAPETPKQTVCIETPLDVTIDNTCDNPLPVSSCPDNPLEVTIVGTNVPQVDLEKFTYCNTDTDTHWQKVCVYVVDPDTLVPTETVFSDADTGVPCTEPAPVDPEIYTVESCVDGILQIQAYQVVFEDGVPAAPAPLGAPVVTGIACGKQTAEIETCDGTDSAEVDHIVALPVGAVITTKPCPVVEVAYDHELVCIDGTLSVVTTVTKGDDFETQDPVPFEPEIECSNPDDFELVTLCGSDGFVQVFAYDNSNLSEPVGKLNTGEPCEACQPFDITEYWKLQGGVAGVNGSRWRDNSAPHGPVDTMFDGCGNHINGAPDEVIVSPNWNVNDLDFPVTGSVSGASQEYYHSWVFLTQGAILEDNNSNNGEFINAYVGGKDQKPVYQNGAANTTGAESSIGVIGSYGMGLYQVAFELSDASSNGGVNLRWSLDGGNTFVAVPEANIYSEPPTITCVKVRVNCDGTMQTLDGLPFNPNDPNSFECEIPCPTIDDTVVPSDIEFQIVLGCDDIDGDPNNVVNVTQETLIVDGERTVTFYTDYGTDAQAEYTVQGTFVDCVSRLPIEEPPIVVNCSDWETLNVYDVLGTNGVNVERWNVNAITGEPVTTVPSDVFTGAPDYSGMPAHDNGAPDGPIIVESDLTVLDQVNDQSQMRGWTYLYAPEPIRLRELQGRPEAVDYFLGECCAKPVKVATGVYPNVTASGSSFDVSLAAGIHYIGFEVFDFSALSGVGYQYSTDNGVTWRTVPASWLFTTKPAISQCAMKVCPETGLIAEIRTGVLNTTASLCEPILCVAPGAVQTDGLQCAPQTFYKVNLPAQGTVEQKWEASALPSGGTGSSYKASFSDTDADGLPAHPNPADTTVSNTLSQTTDILNPGAPDQAMSDFYIVLNERVELGAAGGQAESGGVWIGCSADTMVEIQDALFPNTGAEVLGNYGPGIFRVRLYHDDEGTSGTTRLTANGALIPAYPTEPSVDLIKGWYCDDGKNYNQDKSEELDATYFCEDPRCVPRSCCANGGADLPQTIGRA